MTPSLSKTEYNDSTEQEIIGKAGFTPRSITTHAKVHLGKVDGKSRITLIELDCEASVPGIDAAQFAQIAEDTRTGCPVSAALAAVEIQLNARLV